MRNETREGDFMHNLSEKKCHHEGGGRGEAEEAEEARHEEAVGGDGCILKEGLVTQMQKIHSQFSCFFCSCHHQQYSFSHVSTIQPCTRGRE